MTGCDLDANPLFSNQRVLARQAFEQLGSEFGFGIGHARDRFIEQQQLRVLYQQHANFQKLLLPMG